MGPSGVPGLHLGTDLKQAPASAQITGQWGNSSTSCSFSEGTYNLLLSFPILKQPFTFAQVFLRAEVSRQKRIPEDPKSR